MSVPQQICDNINTQISEAPSFSAKVSQADHDLVTLAENELRRRRLRSRFLPPELFGEGAWTMLLDLFVCRYRGRDMSTKSACLAADVPEPTALRWLGALESFQLVARTGAEVGEHAEYVSLTVQGDDALRSVLAASRC